LISMRPGVRYILTATFFFALMQVGVKWLHRLPVEEIVFFRALVSLAICWRLIKAKGISPWGRNKRFLILRGLSGSIALLLFFYTLQHIPLATAVTLQYLSPIFTILFATFIMRESTGLRQWLAFLIALAGVAMVKGFDPRVSLLDLAVGITSAMFSGLAYNFIRKLKDYDHPLVVVFYFPLVTIPIVLVPMLARWVWPTALEWLLLIMLGLTRAYQLERASEISIFNYLGIAYAIFFGLLIFGEELVPMAALGIAVLIAGVYLGIAGRDGGKLGPAQDVNSQPIS